MVYAVMTAIVKAYIVKAYIVKACMVMVYADKACILK